MNGKKLLLAVLIYILPYRDFPLIMKNPISIRIFDVAVLVCVCAVIISFMYLGKSFKMNLNIMLTYLCFMVWFGIASTVGLYNNGSQSLILRYFILVPYSFLIFILAYNLVLRTRISWFIHHLVISLIIASVISLILNYIYPGLVQTWAGGVHLNDKGFRVNRFAGFASEPNYWGNLFLFLFPITFIGIFNKSIRSELRLNLIMLMIIIIFAVLTFSTFTHLSMLLALVGIFFFKFNNVKKIRMVFVSLTLLALVGLVSSKYVGYIWAKLTTLGTSSSFERFYWSYSAFNMWLESPLIGHGLGTYIFHFKDYIPFITIPPAEQANSVFLATLAEQGIIGLLFLLLMMATLSGLFSRRLMNSIKKNVYLKAMAIGLLLYLPYFLITGTLYLYYFWFYFGAFRGFSEQVSYGGEDI